MGGLAAVFHALDRLTGSVTGAVRGLWRSFLDGPLQGVLVWLILVFTGVIIVLEDLGKAADRAVSVLERVVIVIAMLAMTALTFNEYMAREYRELLGTDFGGLWSLDGQMNLALLLMVVVGFLGASVATQRHEHLSVDATDRVLAPGAARFVKRLTSLVAAGLCYRFTVGASHMVIEARELSVPGLNIWSWWVTPINLLTSQMPGYKFGPGTAYPTQGALEDHLLELGFPWDGLPPMWGMVQAGDKFPLWLPVGLLTIAFAIMTARFAIHALYPPVPANMAPPRAPSRTPADVILAGMLPGALIAMGLGAWLGTGWMILIASIALVFLGAPLFVALGVGTVASWAFLRDGGADTVVADMFESTTKQELLAIPLFVLAGNLMTKGSISERLIDFARALLGNLPGGLGVGAVLSCAFFAAISGSSPVTVIAIGSIVFPLLVREGYGERYAMGMLTTAGGLGIIIPPSIPMIVYAIMVGGIPEIGAQVTPKRLFTAGIGPGLFIAFMLIVYTLYVSWPRPGFEGVRTVRTDGLTYGARLWTSFKRGILSLFLPILILGGIYALFDLNSFGIPFAVRFSVTEAAAVAVVYALFVELFVNRELKWKQLPEVVVESAVMMGSLFLILVIAISLNRFFVWQQVPEAATAWMVAHVHSKLAFLIIVNLFLLALGCVMDILSAILIVAPLLAPIAHSYGIHPVHFAIMFIVNLELGYLTPPMGINLFVASTVFERPLVEVIRSVLPFLLLMLFCLAVIVWFPGLSLALLGDP
jgi:C4-dicarboxylate transporter DctM subunit